MYPNSIMQAVRSNLGLEPDDTTRDDIILKMTKDEVLNKVATWNCLIDYGPTIKNWIESIWSIDLDKISENISTKDIKK